MISNFRRLSKSKIGTGIVATFFIMILAGFAVSDIRNFGSGDIGFGMGGSTLARVGDQQVLDREMSDAMQRRLQEVRRQNPTADYATIAGDFDTLLDALIDQRSLIAFADKYGIHLSKRLIDAEIAQIPQTKGLNGKFSDQGYQQFRAQQRMTDAVLSKIIAGSLL
jgi:peptidyl-prolyl cis-trans isomerase D